MHECFAPGDEFDHPSADQRFMGSMEPTFMMTVHGAASVLTL